MSVNWHWLAGIAVCWVGVAVAFAALVCVVGWRESRRPRPLQPIPAPVVSLDLERARRRRRQRGVA